MAKVVESGADELRRIVRVLGACRESALDGFTAEQLCALTRACWASGWDVYVDDLSSDQASAVLECGEVPAFFDDACGLIPIPSSRAPSEAVHEYLCHGGRSCSGDGDGCDRDVSADRERSYATAQRLRVVQAEASARAHDADAALAVVLAEDFAKEGV